MISIILIRLLILPLPHAHATPPPPHQRTYTRSTRTRVVRGSARAAATMTYDVRAAHTCWLRKGGMRVRPAAPGGPPAPATQTAGIHLTLNHIGRSGHAPRKEEEAAGGVPTGWAHRIGIIGEEETTPGRWRRYTRAAETEEKHSHFYSPPPPVAPRRSVDKRTMRRICSVGLFFQVPRGSRQSMAKRYHTAITCVSAARVRLLGSRPSAPPRRREREEDAPVQNSQLKTHNSQLTTHCVLCMNTITRYTTSYISCLRVSRKYIHVCILAIHTSTTSASILQYVCVDLVESPPYRQRRRSAHARPVLIVLV
jgi:hypothetical protein